MLTCVETETDLTHIAHVIHHQFYSSLIFFKLHLVSSYFSLSSIHGACEISNSTFLFTSKQSPMLLLNQILVGTSPIFFC